MSGLDRLFAVDDPVPVDILSADRRRTLANKRAIANGVHPATRMPLLGDGSTCATCAFLVRTGESYRRFWKCRYHRLGPSRSAASDVRKFWPACALYERVGV